MSSAVWAIIESQQTDPQRSNKDTKDVCVPSFLHDRITPHEELVRDV